MGADEAYWERDRHGMTDRRQAAGRGPRQLSARSMVHGTAGAVAAAGRLLFPEPDPTPDEGVAPSFCMAGEVGAGGVMA